MVGVRPALGLRWHIYPDNNFACICQDMLWEFNQAVDWIVLRNLWEERLKRIEQEEDGDSSALDEDE